MNRRDFLTLSAAGLVGMSVSGSAHKAKRLPNIIFILADDLGYGDVGCYGSKRIPTPHIDTLAGNGVRFTNAHATSATCTPSRYSLLTGEYAWRRKGTNILPGDATALIQPDRTTLPAMLKSAGYATAVVGKWHLGLGSQGGPDWNGEISPGPVDIGFDYCFIMPATGDRVPRVFVENRRVVGLDPADPIQISFTQPIMDEPTGKDHPELLKMHPSHGHDQTIINGVSRIGYMKGGKTARWVDEDFCDTITTKAKQFIRQNQQRPFFLYFATHGIHVPRLPHHRFTGKSGLGPRGDAVIEFDWSVGEIVRILTELGLAKDTLIMMTSDNGPVVDDGYKDRAEELLQDHKPAGPLRGGKYSAFDGGTRVPFIANWPKRIKPSLSDALFSQIDVFASLAALTRQAIVKGTAPDSYNQLATLLGDSTQDRDHVVEHSSSGILSIIKNGWKYIEPGKGKPFSIETKIETGNDPNPQLYHIGMDVGEKKNLAADYPEKVQELAGLLEKIRQAEYR